MRRRAVPEVFDRIAREFNPTRRKPWPSLRELGDCRGIRILDLGAGTGRNTRSLAECGADAVVSADISLEMLKVLMENTAGDMFDRVHPVRCDATCLPFRGSSFQGVAFIAALHHIPGSSYRLKAMEETARVTSPGGKVLITVWDPKAAVKEGMGGRMSPVPGGEPGDAYVLWGKGAKRFYHFFGQSELEDLVKSAGLILCKVFHERASSGSEAENLVVVTRKG